MPERTNRVATHAAVMALLAEDYPSLRERPTWEFAELLAAAAEAVASVSLVWDELTDKGLDEFDLFTALLARMNADPELGCHEYDYEDFIRAWEEAALNEG